MEQTGGRKALFLDRDGIVNEDTGYPHRPEHVVFRAEVFDLCRVARDKGYLLVVVTNQAGVAKGRFTEDEVVKLHEWMSGEFKRRGIEIAGFYFCPHHVNGTVPEYRTDCEDRKPRPGLFLRAARELGIDLASSIMVGDKSSDRIQLPELRCVVVKSKYTGDDFDVGNLDDVKGLLP